MFKSNLIIGFNTLSTPVLFIYATHYVQCSKLDTVALLKRENGLEEIIIYKVIDESHIGNVELTFLDPCGNDLIIYIVGTSRTWKHSMDDVLLVQIVYVGKSGKFMLHHSLLSKTKSQLSSSKSEECKKKTFHYSHQARVLNGVQVGCDSLTERWSFC